MMDRIALAADSLNRAFHGARLVQLGEAAEPRIEADAYAIQDAVLAGEEVAGWKVAPARNGVVRCAPLGVSRLLANGGAVPADMHAPLVEVELAVLLARDVPEGADADQVMAALGTVSLAFEILDSRYVDRKAVSPLSTLADAQSNRAFVAGPSTATWRAVEFSTVPLTLFVDGIVLAETPGGASSAQVAEALVWLACHAEARGLPLRRGQVIITGSRIGPLPLPSGRELLARGGGVGEVNLVLPYRSKKKEVTV